MNVGDLPLLNLLCHTEQRGNAAVCVFCAHIQYVCQCVLECVCFVCVCVYGGVGWGAACTHINILQAMGVILGIFIFAGNAKRQPTSNLALSYFL